MPVITFEIDADDELAIHAAIARYQRTNRWPEGDTLVPEGDGELRGLILGEICRGWMEMIEG